MSKHKKATWILSVLKQKKVIAGIVLIIIPLVILNLPTPSGTFKELLSMSVSMGGGPPYIFCMIIVSFSYALIIGGILLVALGITRKLRE